MMLTAIVILVVIWTIVVAVAQSVAIVVVVITTGICADTVCGAGGMIVTITYRTSR